MRKQTIKNSESLIAEFKRMRSVMHQKAPEDIKPGQIWRVNMNYERARLCIITEAANSMSDEPDSPISACPLNFDFPSGLILENNTLILESEDTPVESPLLVECWNELMLDKKRLVDFIGIVSIKLLKKIKGSIQFERSKVYSGKYSFFRDACSKVSTSLRHENPKDETEWFSLPANEMLPLSGHSDDNCDLLRFYYEKLFLPGVSLHKAHFGVALHKDELIIVSEGSHEFCVEISGKKKQVVSSIKRRANVTGRLLERIFPRKFRIIERNE